MTEKYTTSNHTIYCDGAHVPPEEAVLKLNEYLRMEKEASEKRASNYKEMEKLRWEAEKDNLKRQEAEKGLEKYKTVLKSVIGLI